MEITEVPLAALQTAAHLAVTGERQPWSLVAILDELDRRGVFEDEHGTMSAYRHHEDRGEPPCDACADFMAAKDAQREARLRRERARRSPKRRLRDANFRELHEHWLDVLDCERRGVPHVCDTCPPDA